MSEERRSQSIATEGATYEVERAGLAPDALAGQVTVVTGAGQGIGREIALAFARLGARVVIAEISAAGLETERVIQGAGGQALFVKTDVSSEANVAELVRRTQGAFGPADVLINNAILSPVAPVLERSSLPIRRRSWAGVRRWCAP